MRTMTICKYWNNPGKCHNINPCDECLVLIFPDDIPKRAPAYQRDKSKYRYCWQDPEWKKIHKEKEKLRTEKQKLDRKLNPDKYRIKDKQLRENNRERYLIQHRIDSHIRRRRENRVGRKIKKDQWINLCEKFDNKCLACGEPGNYLSLQMDHIIPIKKGGKNAITNIQPLCKKCNISKGIKIIDYRI